MTAHHAPPCPSTPWYTPWCHTMPRPGRHIKDHSTRTVTTGLHQSLPPLRPATPLQAVVRHSLCPAKAPTSIPLHSMQNYIQNNGCCAASWQTRRKRSDVKSRHRRLV